MGVKSNSGDSANQYFANRSPAFRPLHGKNNRQFYCLSMPDAHKPSKLFTIQHAYPNKGYRNQDMSRNLPR